MRQHFQASLSVLTCKIKGIPCIFSSFNFMLIVIALFRLVKLETSHLLNFSIAFLQPMKVDLDG